MHRKKRIRSDWSKHDGVHEAKVDGSRTKLQLLPKTTSTFRKEQQSFMKPSVFMDHKS